MREELKKYFHVIGTDKDSLDFSKVDMDYDIDQEKFDDFKKYVIRELRLSKILDGVDIEEKAKIIGDIKDRSIWQSDRRKIWEHGEVVPTQAWGRTLEEAMENSEELPQMKSSFVGMEIDLDKTYNATESESISDHIEKLIIDKYRELALINRVKLEEFRGVDPAIVESSDQTRISAKINMGSHIILHESRVGHGNVVIVNPITYIKLRHIFESIESNDKMKRDVFQSKFIPENEVMVTQKKEDINSSFFVVSHKTGILDTPNHIIYGYTETSNRPENYCWLVSIV